VSSQLWCGLVWLFSIMHSLVEQPGCCRCYYEQQCQKYCEARSSEAHIVC